MKKLSKKRKEALRHYQPGKPYALQEAASLVKKISDTNFDASVDLAVRLGIDPKKSDQMVRGTLVFPHGTGKKVRVLVLCTADKEQEAKDAGADHVGLDDYLQKITDGWTDIDVIITMPSVMARLGVLGKVLGPKGLMPNPKSGTVTQTVGRAVQDVKRGKVELRSGGGGIVHASVGRCSFSPKAIEENALEAVHTLIKLKPSGAKGTYLRSLYLSSTMSGSLLIGRGDF